MKRSNKYQESPKSKFKEKLKCSRGLTLDLILKK
jgi:hypothetical protein